MTLAVMNFFFFYQVEIPVNLPWTCRCCSYWFWPERDLHICCIHFIHVQPRVHLTYTCRQLGLIGPRLIDVCRIIFLRDRTLTTTNQGNRQWLRRTFRPQGFISV